jgi:hypothetical protein
MNSGGPFEPVKSISETLPYDSRADVLLLVGAPSEGDVDILPTLVQLFSPDWLGFERVRVGLPSQILETIKPGTRT